MQDDAASEVLAGNPDGMGQEHMVWVPKYRYRVLQGDVKREVATCVHVFSEQKGCEVVEMNVQQDHVYLIVMIPPKVSISDYMGMIKGRTAIRIFKRFSSLRQRPYWGNHFWSRGYCVDTVGINAEMIRKYVQYQEKRERRDEQLRINFGK